MSANLSNPTVFLSYSVTDSTFAQAVSEELGRAGAKVWKIADVTTTGNYTNEVRRLLDRSGGVVVALGQTEGRRETPASVLFEIGAAAGARKPVFVVVDSPVSILPFNVPEMHVIPFNRIGEIPQLIAAANSVKADRKTG